MDRSSTVLSSGGKLMTEPTGKVQNATANDMEAMMHRLSPREREVAELVTEGLSDREISARLFIARRTAESHVASILSKFGFSSRVQVATFIARQSAVINSPQLIGELTRHDRGVARR